MHKGVILLVKAGTRTEAEDKVNSFMDTYQNNVWDWYQIGGRWSGTLAPMYKEFMEKSKKILKEEEGGFISMAEVNKKQEDLQKLWLSLKGIGPNPYADHYKLPDEGGVYDVMLLSECIDIVKEWLQDPEKEGKEAMEKAKRWLKPKNEKDDWNMYGYCLREASNLFQQDFSFDTNVYNIDSYNFAIPKELKEFYAVMVDMHN